MKQNDQVFDIMSEADEMALIRMMVIEEAHAVLPAFGATRPGFLLQAERMLADRIVEKLHDAGFFRRLTR